MRGIDLREKNGVVLIIFCLLMQKGLSVAHSPYNISQSTVGQSIAFVSDLGGIITLALCASV